MRLSTPLSSMIACMLACRIAVWVRLGTKQIPEQAAVWGQRGPENEPKQAQNGPKMPVWVPQMVQIHFCRGAASTGVQTCAWAIWRGRTHSQRGLTRGKSALGIAFQAPKPEIRPFYGLGLVQGQWAQLARKTAQNWAPPGRQHGPLCPKWRSWCAPI